MNFDKICALTFDDGPSSVTPLFLEKLKKYGVTASFFMVGNNISEKTESIVRQVCDMGCEINNHSRTHSVMSKMEADKIREEIEYTNNAVMKITGEAPKFFRPPYIAVSSVMYESTDLPFIAGFGAEDWSPEVTAGMRAERIIFQARDGCIFLLHDSEGNTCTAEALDIIIPSLLEKGYGFVTVSELFKAKKITPQKGIVYSYAEQTTEYAVN